MYARTTGETVLSELNERIVVGSEQPASEEEESDVEGHRYRATDAPDERIAFGTEQPEVEGYSAQAVERLQRFIEADEAASRVRGTESGQGSGPRGAEQTGAGAQEKPDGA